jgi:hypothetical protein
MAQSTLRSYALADRFRGFYPVVVDVETGDSIAMATLLEIAAVLLK